MFDKRWFLFDFARGRRIVDDETADLLAVLSNAGYNGVCIHLEGFFEMQSFPGVVRDGYLTIEQAKRFKKECSRHGLEVAPIINLVGHAESFVYFQERFCSLMRDREHHQLDLHNRELDSFARTIVDEVIAIFEPEYIHIGGDETTLDEEEKKLYGEFLSRMCEYVRSRGVIPGIWGDMLYEHREIAESFTKDIALFDWWYNGHRIESLEYFKEQGFGEVFACPSDQGWDGFIGVQRKCPWPHVLPKDARSVLPFEVEAFLKDAKELGINHGLLTNWEDRKGHNLWSQMAQIVRGGLFMADKEYGEKAVEKALFGRETPFTKISCLLSEMQSMLYNAVPEKEKSGKLACRISDALFDKGLFKALVNNSQQMIGEIEKGFEDGFGVCEQQLGQWQPIGSVEERCYTSLCATVDYAKALFALIKLASHGYDAYHKAAVLQFCEPDEGIEQIEITARLALEFSEKVKAFCCSQTDALALCGQQRTDIDELKNLYEEAKGFYGRLLALEAQFKGEDKTALRVLPSFQMLLDNSFRFSV